MTPQGVGLKAGNPGWLYSILLTANKKEFKNK